MGTARRQLSRVGKIVRTRCARGNARADDFAHPTRFIEDGAPTWPNGYDWDPIALHDEMKRAGRLRRVDAAE